MRILVVCQYYYPEPFRITDICEEWVKQGHEVQVVTGKPNYPMGEVYKGYEGKEKQDEVVNGVKIHRCYEVPRKKGILYRFLNYYSFMFSANKYIKKIKSQFDVVFANQLSPIMMAKPAITYKKKYGSKVVLYCLDLWPESLVAGGVKRNSFLYRHYHKVSKKIYNSVDKIAITSQLFKRYLNEQFSLPDDKITYMPQYAEDIFGVNDCLKEANGRIDLLFAGNIGQAQSVETIIRAANETKDLKNLYWHIVGDGSALEKCKTLSAELNIQNIIFYGRKPLKEMPSFYQKADAMLVTLMKDDVLSLTLPGKVQTYMAAGKPIIASADGEIATVIQDARCGFCVLAESYRQLAYKVREFCKLQEEKRIELGKNSRDFYEKNFDKAVFFGKVKGVLDESFNDKFRVRNSKYGAHLY